MKTRLLLSLFLGFSCSAFGQVLPEERSVDWTSAGIEDEFLQSENVITFSGNAEGNFPNDTLLDDILNSLNGEPATIHFPAGTFLFHEPISLGSNITIQGESTSVTKLIFELNSEDNLINISGSESSQFTSIAESASKGANLIEVLDPAPFSSGDFIKIFEDDEELITSSWALHSTGQILKIMSIEGNTLFLNDQIRREFSTERNARAQKFEMVENVSIENLTIERLDQTEWQTSNIFMNYAANCRVKCVESINCNFAHVDIRNSTNCEVTGSYFHHAFDYGSGGKAYGVVLQFTTGTCLVENNIFEHLRHSMLLQAGANGNVLGYNYSIDPFWSGVMLPANSAGDIVLHGNYPYANLIEGNTVQNIVIDNSHGINGEFNTFFRNRAELYGIVMNNGSGDRLNFIGNEMTNSEFLMGNYMLTGADHFELGNNKTGTIIPSGTGSLAEESMYWQVSPEFYLNNSTWPPIGIPKILNAHKIEAEERYNSGAFTSCDEWNPVSIAETDKRNNSIVVYPNPTSGKVCIKHPALVDIISVEVLSLNGTIMLSVGNEKCVDISELPAGYYFLKSELSSGKQIFKKILKI